MIYDELLVRFTEMSKEVFSNNLVGVYLHGSLAMGCFNPLKSDIDLILIVKNDISDTEKIDFLNHLLVLNNEAPEKGFELSIVKQAYCNPLVYPTPYELHFSSHYINWIRRDIDDYVQTLKGTDKDLGAHFTIINHYGVVLYGKPIAQVFGEVSKKDYIDSIWFDVENGSEEILKNPMYMTLNLCRVLAYLRNGLVLSKKAGGEWAVQNMPTEYRPFIQNALQSYLTDQIMDSDSECALNFAGYMLSQIKGAF